MGSGRAEIHFSQTARLKKKCASGEPPHLLFRMGDIKNRNIERLCGTFDEAHQQTAALRIKARKRLIEYEKRFSSHQCASQCNALSFTAGKAARMTMEKPFKAKGLHHFCEINSRSAPAGRLRKTNIFFDREVRQKTGRLKNESDAAGFRRKVDAARSAED